MTETAGVTPMMAQYLEIKAGHPDALLFYRMGDFYEMFFDDAVAAAEALDIALTKRGKHMGQDIAMCGVPVHAAESYLLTLIRKGFRAAIDSYSAFFENDRTTPTGLEGYLRTRGIDRLTVVGLATDFCVHYSALDGARPRLAVIFR